MAAYHEQTKHHLRRHARSAGYMDWANEPDPFRRYRGAELLRLEHLPPETAEGPHYDLLFLPGAIPAQAVDRQSISQLFYDSLALSAWKEYRGARWSLRVNPSSGDLHPTEGYLICGSVSGLHDRPAVFHYAPREHGLEVRTELTEDAWRAVSEGLPPSSLLVGFTSIYWRESWKYGERAFRYCQHDLGHAIAAVAIAAAVLGWEARLLEGVTDNELAKLMGVHRQRGIEVEHAECLLALYPRGGRKLSLARQREYCPAPDAIAGIGDGDWSGRPNRLSAEHLSWPIIDTVSRASLKEHTSNAGFWSPAKLAPQPASPKNRGLSARQVIRQRRSALAFDGKSAISRTTFYRMLQRVLPASSYVPLFPWRPAVHLLLFVHRVNDLDRGLYLLVRDPDQLEALRSAITRRFEWRRAPGCPSGMHFYRLRKTDCRKAAQISSCHQEVAADGAFAAAMLAEFEPRLAVHGAWFYRRIHWEAGAIGQVLYLEAEAAGIRSTGIGCFFDDTTHEILGLADRRYQTIYHFTVGAPVEDTRLTSLPAYPGPLERPPRVGLHQGASRK